MGKARPNQNHKPPGTRAANRQRVRDNLEDIIKAYQTGMTMKALVVKYEVSSDFIKARFAEKGQPVRNGAEAGKIRRLYK